MSDINITVNQTLQNIPVMKHLLEFLPNEIVCLIAFKFRAIQPYYIYHIQIELNRIRWEIYKGRNNKTLYRIYYYRSYNIINDDAFKFPNASPPYINKKAKICNVREIKIKYQNYTSNNIIKFTSIPFSQNKKFLLYQEFHNLVNNDPYLSDCINDYIISTTHTFTEMIRAYYRFDLEKLLQTAKRPDFSKYIQTIIYPWVK